jgi:uncharacterized protein (DUF2236 family)
MRDTIVTTPLARLVRGGLADLAPAGVPGLRRLVRGAVASALNGQRPGADHQPSTDAGDPGLHGPGSASWQVLSDVSGLPAGVRALLLQTLHPLAVAGVSDHSGYRDDQWGRLHRTGAWVAIANFGSVPEVLRISRIVRAQHRRVVGTAPDGRPYAADTPDLLAWVSLTFTDSLLAMDHALGAHPVRGADADRFVLEQSIAGALLDPRVDLDALDTPKGHARLRRGEVDLPLLEDGLLPHDVATLHTALERYRPTLAMYGQGEEIVDFLRDPGLAPFAMPAYRVFHAASIATMPDWIRDVLRIGPPRALDPVVLAQADALLTGLRLGLGGSPARASAERRVLTRAA